MEIKNNIPVSLVKEKYNKEKDGRIKQRLLIVLKAYKEKSSYKIAEDVNTSHTKVQRWINRFNKKGFEGLDDKFRSGRPKFIKKKQILQLEKNLTRKSEFRAGYNTLEIVHMINAEFRVSYTPRHVRRLLQVLGYSQIIPRPRHINKDPIKGKEIVDNLKKTYNVWVKNG